MDIDEGRLADRIAQRLSTPPATNAVIDFQETYRQLDWDRLLASAYSRVDIVVYYFDSWVNQHSESLRGYFQRPGTRMRLFVSDPTIEELLDGVAKLFPDYDRERVREKIERTGERLRKLVHEAGADASRLEVYYVPRPLSYSAQALDDKVLVLSVFEM